MGMIGLEGEAAARRRDSSTIDEPADEVEGECSAGEEGEEGGEEKWQDIVTWW